jgi:hypothetical protein
MLTERDIAILRAVARYYVLSRGHIQRLCFPDDGNGRITRRRLQLLVTASLLNRTPAPVFNPNGGSPWPAYYPARRGLEVLAEFDDDERYLLTPTQSPQPHFLLHWLAVSETHLTLDSAIARQSAVTVDDWINEWDIVNKDESAPEKRFRLFTLLRESPRLVCAPDSAFLLSVAGHRKAFYLEQDRNTSGVRQIAASKTQGYAVMAHQKLHLRHFPTATVETFGVVMIAPTERRRDALRKAIADKPGATLWRFASATDLTPETFLHSSIFYPCVGERTALVKAPSVPPTSESTKTAFSSANSMEA